MDHNNVKLSRVKSSGWLVEKGGRWATKRSCEGKKEDKGEVGRRDSRKVHTLGWTSEISPANHVRGYMLKGSGKGNLENQVKVVTTDEEGHGEHPQILSMWIRQIILGDYSGSCKTGQNQGCQGKHNEPETTASLFYSRSDYIGSAMFKKKKKFKT